MTSESSCPQHHETGASRCAVGLHGCPRCCGHTGIPGSRTCVVAFPRGRRHDGEVPRPLRALRRPGRRDRPVLAGAHPSGKNRAPAAPSAVRGDPHPVPAVARFRRVAMAAGLAVGVHQAGWLQAGLRHRQAIPTTSRSTAFRSPRVPPTISGGAWRRSTGAPIPRVNSRQCAATWRHSKPGLPPPTPERR